VLSNNAGLPEAAATIHRLVCKWQVPNDRITFDMLGIGRKFPNHLTHRLVEELRPLTYSLIGRKTELMPKDEWAKILGHSPDTADALIQSMILTP